MCAVKPYAKDGHQQEHVMIEDALRIVRGDYDRSKQAGCDLQGMHGHLCVRGAPLLSREMAER